MTLALTSHRTRPFGVWRSALCVLGLFADVALSADEPGQWSVQRFGARADGTNDSTAAFQQALDEAGKTGGKVLLPPGRYRVAGSLRIPPGVTLQGATDSPVWSQPLNGSVILATGGRDQEDAPALFELAHSATVRGLTVWYIKVNAIQPMGLLITGGQFVCMHGDIRVPLLVESTCHGSVRLVNCAFWGPNRQCVVSHSRRFVSLSDCYVSSSGQAKNPGVSLIEADRGKQQVRGYSFGSDEPAIALKAGLQPAIIAENNGVRGVEIRDDIGDKASFSNNEPPIPSPGK